MADECIRKADVVRTCGGYGELAKIMSRLPSADVVKVIRCQNCKHHSYDVAFSCYWCEYPGRVRETTADGFCDDREEYTPEYGRCPYWMQRPIMEKEG